MNPIDRDADVIVVTITTPTGHTTIRHHRRQVDGVRGKDRWEPLSATLNRAVRDARTWVARNAQTP